MKLQSKIVVLGSGMQVGYKVLQFCNVLFQSCSFSIKLFCRNRL